jgi:hypothetical protein
MSRPKLTPDTVEKTCPTCNKQFVISFYLRNRRTYCSRTCANHDPIVIRRMVASQTKTFNKNYGMHPMKTENTKKTLRSAIKEKYGVEWISSSDGWYDKVKATKKKLHGTENYNNIGQIKQTCLKKYGVPNYRMTDEYKKQYRATCLMKYGVPHASMGKKFKVEHNRTMFEKFLLHPKFVNFTPQFTVEDYRGVSYSDYTFECKRCGTVKSYSINNGKFPSCPSCDKNNCSTFQNEIYEYIKSTIGNGIDIKLNDRTILKPRELDIVIPSLKVAFECDGVLWHSDIFGHKNKTYHLQKTSGCISGGYRLIHIFDSEWRTRPDVVKSVIASVIGKVAPSIYGRKCVVKEISSRICTDFLNKNHLQGTDHSSIKLGLFDEQNNLVSVMTFLKSRFDTKVQYEMGRFCNKINTHIAGGASKLFSYFLRNYHPTSIVSYNDRRYFDGEVYIKLGFNFVGNTSPNYFYIIDNYQTIQNRLCWQKHKLKDKLAQFDSTLSEWENMKQNGYDRIWDCGNGKWIWTIH